jgi:cytochrome c oxidase subunit 2
MDPILSKLLRSLCLFLLVAAGCSQEVHPVVNQPELQPSQKEKKTPLHVRMTGDDFHWKICYPGPDGMLDTADDVLTERHLHLPTNTDIKLELCSNDYVYSLFLPEYDLLEIAFPGRPYLMEFRTESSGTSRLLGAQMCGYTHQFLLGNLVALVPADFQQWAENASSATSMVSE